MEKFLEDSLFSWLTCYLIFSSLMNIEYKAISNKVYGKQSALKKGSDRSIIQSTLVHMVGMYLIF